jgi:desampylase
MALKISSELRAILLSEAAAAHPRECCGLLLGRGNVVTRLRIAKNVSANPCTHFEIDPAVLIAAEKAARAGEKDGEGNETAILGYYHSHPRCSNVNSANDAATPSTTDAAMAAVDGRYWVVISGEKLGVFRAVECGELWGRFEVEALCLDDY